MLQNVLRYSLFVSMRFCSNYTALNTIYKSDNEKASGPAKPTIAATIAAHTHDAFSPKPTSSDSELLVLQNAVVDTA